MNSRISLVLKAKNISPAQLADELGVQRSGISHILNGRNKPSLDFIQKLLKRYPDISMAWLMFGEGPMMNPYVVSDTSKKQQQSFSEIKPSLVDLFSTTDEDGIENEAPEPLSSVNNGSNETVDEMITSIFQEEIKSTQKNSNQSEPQTTPASVIEEHTEEPNKVPHAGKKPRITRIVIFYDNRTFVEYSPGND